MAMVDPTSLPVYPGPNHCAHGLLQMSASPVSVYLYATTVAVKQSQGQRGAKQGTDAIGKYILMVPKGTNSAKKAAVGDCAPIKKAHSICTALYTPRSKNAYVVG